MKKSEIIGWLFRGFCYTFWSERHDRQPIQTDRDHPQDSNERVESNPRKHTPHMGAIQARIKSEKSDI